MERLCLFPQDPYFQSEHVRFKVVNVRLPSPCIRVECTFPCLKAASVPLSTSFTWTPASHQTYKVTEALYLKCAYILCASFLWLVISRSSHHVWRWGCHKKASKTFKSLADNQFHPRFSFNARWVNILKSRISYYTVSGHLYTRLTGCLFARLLSYIKSVRFLECVPVTVIVSSTWCRSDRCALFC